MSLLKVRGLTAGYGAVEVLHGIDLDVEDGEIVVILGANGAGKTTTMRAVSGMIARTGTLELSGVDIARTGAEKLVRLGIAHVPQGRGTFAELSVIDNLRTGAYSRKTRAEVDADIDRWFDVFPRLAERRDQRAGSLSGGEQQMLAIGRALLGKPTLMLLDEPSLGLAPMVVEGIFEIVARINRERGVAMLLVEQNAMAAFGIARYGYIMESGKVVIDGPTERLVNDPDVQRFYLGYGDGSEELASFRHVKHYKRRKRWLS